MNHNNYTLNYVIGKPNTKGLCKVYLRYFSPTADWLLYDKVIRVPKEQFNSNNIKAPVSKANPLHLQYNNSLNAFRIKVEQRLLDAVGSITKEYLLGEQSSVDSVVDFITDFVAEMRKENEKDCDLTSRGKKRAKGKLSEGRLKIYETVRDKIKSFDSKVTFSQVDVTWLNRLESAIRKRVSQNTLNSNMTVMKAILSKAADRKLILKSKYEVYTPPEYEEDIPEYLEEFEIDAFYEVVKSVSDPEIKTCGYYFLLGCYAGYRISDLFSFNYEDRVRGNKIILRAKKNGVIVSIPIYPRLKEIVDYCRNHKIGVTEEHMRKKVKLIASLAGISGRRNIKVHTARHSFAMMFIEKGLNVEEVAELLGDSVEVARRYARITNKHLHNRIERIMGT